MKIFLHVYASDDIFLYENDENEKQEKSNKIHAQQTTQIAGKFQHKIWTELGFTVLLLYLNKT